MHFSTLLILSAASLGLTKPIRRQSLPNPNDVYIDSFTYAGSGCPAGSVANATDATKTVLTLLYDDYGTSAFAFIFTMIKKSSS